MHQPDWRCVLLISCILFTPFCRAADIEATIVATCKSELSGNERMIKTCITQETTAYQALKTYHPTLKPIIDECKKKVGKHGWNMLKMCTDKQILAEKAIVGSQ